MHVASCTMVSASTKRDGWRGPPSRPDFVRDQMDECPAAKQVLILDCCYSGAVRG